MPTNTKWSLPGRIILQHFYGPVPLEDLNASMDAHFSLVQAGTPLVHTVMDMAQVESHPSVVELQQGAAVQRDEKEGWRLIVGADGVVRFAVSFMMQQLGQRFRFFDTVDDALFFLQEQDETLDLTQVEY